MKILAHPHDQKYLQFSYRQRFVYFAEAKETKEAPKGSEKPKRTYEENYKKGPFGAFANEEILKESSRPHEMFLGQPITTPFGIPAGPLLNGKFIKAALDKGFDLSVYKTVRMDMRVSSHDRQPVFPKLSGVHLSRIFIGIK